MMTTREAAASVPWALAAGYRGFDCAQMYRNERETGHGIADFLASDTANVDKLKREDIFYTSKLASNSESYETVRWSIQRSVEASGLGYIDLFLLHSPYGGRKARLTSWRALEDAVLAGEVRMAGVSNYGVYHVSLDHSSPILCLSHRRLFSCDSQIEELMTSHPRVPPVINQIEVHPFNTQTAIRATCAKHSITVEAYAPLVRGMRMKHPTIVQLAKKYGCTPAQLLVRWGLQHDMVALPKSARKERLVENADVAGFEISREDLLVMDGLDENLVTDW